MSDLIHIEDAAEVFHADKVDSILAKIEDRASSMVFDIDTVEGRADCKSTSAQIARIKTFLDAAGKDIVGPLKEQAKVVDAQRKNIRDTLDNLKAKVRRPLTEYEDAINQVEIDRQALSKLYQRFKMGLAPSGVPLSLEGLNHALDTLRDDDTDLARFGKEAEEELIYSRDEAIAVVQNKIAVEQQILDDQRELEELRKLKHEASLKSREAEIKASAVAEVEERVKAQQEAERVAENARRDERKHRDKILLEVKDAIEENGGITPSQAGLIVRAMFCGKIPHTLIQF